jgi:hypothetical protein
MGCKITGISTSWQTHEVSKALRPLVFEIRILIAWEPRPILVDNRSSKERAACWRSPVKF